jgi:transposase InsO family protein
MQVHSNATTNKKQRERLHFSNKSCRALAEEMAISTATAHRWKHRDSPQDKSCCPKNIEYIFDRSEQALILSLRQKGVPLDDLVDLVQQPLPEASRSSVYRLLKRNGVSRLAKKEEQETGQDDKHGQFKDYGPGFVHIDCFYLPKLEGQKRYCFVAIDRATRLSLLWVYEHKDKKAATDFLKRCLSFFPFQVSKILTDNGREFSLKGFKNRYGTQVKAEHDFEQLCQEQQIEHRTTLPYTPKTNGMVERMNGLTKENTTKKNRYETVQEMLDDLHGWFVRYNFCRKNRRIGSKTPYEAVLTWYQKDPSIFVKEPTALLAFRSQSGDT